MENIKETYQEIELRSNEVQDILSRPPHLLVRCGTMVFFVVIALFFIGGCFFYYPDVITAEIVITTERPPVWIIARGTGRLKDIYKHDLQKVVSGEVIAVLENSAITSDVIYLKSRIHSFLVTDSAVCQVSFPEKLSLGSIQNSYNSFMKNLIAYRDFIQLDLYMQKEKAARTECEEYGKYIVHLNRQVELNKEELRIAEIVYQREKTLFKRSVISQADYELAQQTYLERQQNTEQLMTSLSSARIQQAQLKQNIIEIQMQRDKDKNNLLIALRTAYDELLVSIASWELDYLLVTPTSGILSYNQVWQENQEIKVGDKIFSIVAKETGDVIGKINLPLSGAGKVKVGQRVNISVADYPYMEYGYLTGKVQSISLLANEDRYTVTVELPQDLYTSYKKPISFKGELSGSGEVVTDERSLTGRLVSPLRYLWEKYF